MHEDEGRNLRLFVAVELPEEMRRAVTDQMEALRGRIKSQALRWVRPEGVHITLSFLGSVPKGRVPAIVDALHEAIRDVRPFELAPLGVGSFGGRARMRVVWLGVGGHEEALAALAKRVQEALEPLGFQPEARAFNAHLTLARVREDAPREERERIHDIITRVEAPDGGRCRVEHISLMRSTLRPGGAVYDALERFEFEPGAEA